jgi:lysophospholipase L1-like esterase
MKSTVKPILSSLLKSNKMKVLIYIILILFITGISVNAQYTLGKKGIGAYTFIQTENISKIKDLNVSWLYDWDVSLPVTGMTGYYNGPEEFVPMIWGKNATDANINYLKAGKESGKLKHLLGFNEPDGADQANMTVTECLDLWPKLMSTGLILGSPAPANSKWLEEFMAGIETRGYRVDFIAVHTYQDFTDPNAPDNLKNWLTDLYNRYHRPIWLTEFGAADVSVWNLSQSGTPTVAKAQEYIKQCMDILTSLPFVERYAWFADYTQAPYDNGTIYSKLGVLSQVGLIFKDYIENTDNICDLFNAVAGETPGTIVLSGLTKVPNKQVYNDAIVDIGNGDTYTISGLAAGTYTIMMYGWDGAWANGCSKTFTIVVLNSGLPVAPDPYNGGFESQFTAWQKTGNATNIDIDSTNVYEGKYSVRLGNNTCGLVSDTLSVTPLNIVTLNSFIKCDNSNISATAFIIFFDSENKILLESTTKTTDNSWLEKSIYTMAPARAKYLKYGVRRNQSSTEGNIYVDANTIDLNAAGPKVDKAPLCNIDQYMQAFWKTDTTWDETVLMLSNDGQPATGRLLFQPAKILSVKSYDLSNTYQSGVDFVINNNTISRTDGSQMPFKTDVSFSKADLAWYNIQSQWIVVTYTHQRTWNGPVPEYKGELLPNTIKKLQSKTPLRIAAYGMSITRGLDVSGYNDVPPYMPAYVDLFANHLKKIFGYNDIMLFNAGLPGSTVKWGSENTGLYINPLQPDLVIIDFGMNDFWSYSPAVFKGYIQTIMNRIKAVHSNVEFLLLTNMFFDPDYILPSDSYATYYNGNMKGYGPVLKAMEKSGVVNVDIATISDTIYRIKNAKDCLANPLHPNDYMARWYAQSIIAAFENHNADVIIDNTNPNDPFFKVYPNPSNGSLYVENNHRDSSGCFVTISNLLGQEFKRTILSSVKTSVYINDLSKGVYIISLKNKDSLLTAKRFIIE